MKKSTTYSDNPQHWATESLQDDMRPMTNQHSLHTQVLQPTHAGATTNARRCISQRTQVRYTPPTTGFARRAFLLVSFLLLGLGNVWGQTLTKGTPSVTIEKDLTITGVKFIITETDFVSILGEYPKYVRFSAYNSSGNPIDIKNVESPYITYKHYDTYDYVFSPTYDGENFLWSGVEVTVTMEETPTKLECYTHTTSQLLGTGNFTELDGGTLIIYEVPAQDDFNGTYSGSDPTPITHVVENVENTTATITFTPTISNAKYARFVLEKDGSVQSSSYDNLTLKSGNEQKDPDWQKHGIYVYREEGLTSEDLTVTVSLDAGTFPEYQLVAYFSDEAPTLEGTTITKEPENLKEKQIYSFTYPVKTVDIYFEWDKTSQEIDLRSYLQNDFPVLLESNLEKGYIAWSIYDGPYGVGKQINIHYNQNDWPHSYWAISLPDDSEISNPKDHRWSSYFNTTVYTPEPQKFSDYPDYVVVCEVSDESKNNIKVRYIFHFNENGKVPFPGKLIGEKDGETLTVNRSDNNVPIELGNAINHEKLVDGVKYARFYLTDYKGNLVDPTDQLTVSGGNVSICTETEFGGSYIYDNGNTLDLSDVSVTLNTPNEYKLYKVVGVFATDMKTAIFENGTMAREPDWDLQYTYSFDYNISTENFGDRVAWRRNGMTPVASTDDPDSDWNISWEELALEHYVKWYVVKGNEVQPLKEYTGSRGETWTIDADGYKVTDDGIAVLTGQSVFSSSLWENWAKPTIYPPIGVEFEDDYQIICEIYTNSKGNGNPNAKYIFSLYKSFLGELKDKGIEGGESIPLSGKETETNISLSNVLQAYSNAVPGHLPVKYARIWLTTTGGTMLDPTGTEALTVSSAMLYNAGERTDKTFGYYITATNEGGIDLGNIIATLSLPKNEIFDQYQVHVALSTDALTLPIGDTTYEPDYDYEYTFSFQYPWKTKYKTLILDGNSCTPDLFTHWQDLAVDCNAKITTDEDIAAFKQSLYVRWYLMDLNGQLLPIQNFTSMSEYTKMDGNNGYYRFGGFNFEKSRENRTNNQVYNPTITLSDDYKDNYKQVRVVCIATTKTEGSGSGTAPTEIQVKYIYTLYTKNEVRGTSQVKRFVHYQGETYRYLMEDLGDVEEANKRGYTIAEGRTPDNNYTWNISTGSAEPTSKNIRQGVHTWEYDIYIIPGEERALTLPIENYNTAGQDLEPQAYIRWYDWNTDKSLDGNDGVFTFNGSFLEESDDRRGLFCIYKAQDQDLYHKNIGVIFKPEDYTKSVDIACDVSKYSDGMVEIDGTYYLLHEPTLSNRYIFHIHPAKEMADELYKDMLNMRNAGGDAKALYKAMSELEEDKGKVIVSLGEDYDNSKFSLRFDLPRTPVYNNKGEFQWSYTQSYVLKNEVNYVQATHFQWYAYFEDNNGSIGRKQLVTGETESRIVDLKYSDFTVGTYSNLNGGTNIDASKGRKFHVVGYMGVGDFNIDNKDAICAPVVHYELHFIDAPPKKLDQLPDFRTDAYMDYYYTRAAILDFDGNPKTNNDVKNNPSEARYYYSTPNWDDKPTSSAENLSYVPFPWDHIQYGFCHPELTQTIKNGMYTGVAPEHGDYIVVKSMNVSENNMSTNSNYSQGLVSPPYDSHWWDGTPLYDYTHTVTDASKYGSFLYTDASDESRTIAKIPFTAKDLCGGSSIYFTAVIANMTAGGEESHTPPQLLIRIVGIDKDGNRQRIVAFHTGELSTANNVSLGEWYQVYGVTTLPNGFDTELTEFEAEVINYASGATGADFAFDQFVIYTSTAKVLLTQTNNGECESDEENLVKVYMEADGLLSAYGPKAEPQAIYWRICDEDLDENGNVKVITGPGMYPQYSCTYDEVTGKYEITLVNNDADGTNEYGIMYVVVKSNYSEEDLMKEGDLYGWEYDATTKNYFFQIANKTFDALEKGKNYYVSVFNPNYINDFDNSNANDAYWGREDIKCSIYSEFFIPRRQYVTYIVDAESGEEGSDFVIGCGSTEIDLPAVKMVMKVPDPEDKITGFQTYDDWRFDYAFFDVENWNNENKYLDDSDKYTYADLYTAWRDYRGVSSPYADENYTASGLDENYNNKINDLDCQAVLKYAIEKGLLVLANSSTYKPTINRVGTHHIICLPIKQEVEINGENKTVCAPFEVTFNVMGGGGPSLELGFSDVTYPSTGYEKRVVRVGMEQLTNLRENGYMLHVPVRAYQDNDKAQVRKLYFTNEYLTISKVPADPTGSGYTTTTKFAKIVAPSNTNKPYVNADRMYLALDLSGTNCNIDFHEGYEYEVSTSYYDELDEGNSGRCQGDIYLVIKVVPKYVTWNDGTTTEKPNTNANWNNDKNWSRSKRAELYKSASQYDNNSDIFGQEVETPAAFVPMKFTYVTIPSNNVAPELVNLTMGTIVGTNNGIYTNIGTGATGNIQYDMMVRYTEKNCVTEKHEEYDTNANIYDCEKFYGNWAKEIYFKPEAELVNQHYLTYEKVWVEKKLTAGQWTLMSTPLQNTYAGDMYVPFADGKQATEAFQPIEFNTTTYSRTKYPIYQRSWAQTGSQVYTKTNDVRKTDYSANLVGNVNELFALWSHTYNDVWVDYSKWKGFAIRAHKSDYSGAPNALLRLPKADNKYDYYDWNDGNGEQPTPPENALSRNNSGKLFTDASDAVNGVTYGVAYGSSQERTAGDGNVSEVASVVQNADNYVLVGNPYLCSIDMSEFFKENYKENGTGSLAVNGYWTYEDNTVLTPLTDNKIRPLQSFFVKANSGATIEFTPAMMTDGNNSGSNNGSRTFALTATNSRGQSMATVTVGEEARSVETLFDSNLADVPMVYTVADGQAVSINQVTELDRPIAFGVTCAASDEPVAVMFSDIAQLTSGEVYVVDAVTGEQMLVGEGSTVSVQPNDYGRYFLLAGTLGIREQADVQQGIMVSVRGRVVTVTSGEVLTAVRAVAADGTTVHQTTDGSTTTSFTLATPGVYIIKAENAAGEQLTVKVVVK